MKGCIEGSQSGAATILISHGQCGSWEKSYEHDQVDFILNADGGLKTDGKDGLQITVYLLLVT